MTPHRRSLACLAPPACAVLVAIAAPGCKGPTQEQYKVIATLPPAGAEPPRVTSTIEHLKEDFTVWGKMPIRVRWEAGADDGGCRRVLSAEVSRTGGPTDIVVSAPTDVLPQPGERAPEHLLDQWIRRASCPGGVETIWLRLAGQRGTRPLTATFSIDGAGQISPVRDGNDRN